MILTLAACQIKTTAGVSSTNQLSQTNSNSSLIVDTTEESDSDPASTSLLDESNPAELPPLASVADAILENSDPHESPSDYHWQKDSMVQITLNGDTASVTGDGVSIAGSTVTITTPGTYHVSGSLSQGQIIVDIEDAEQQETGTEIVRLILNGVQLANTIAAPIYIRQAEKTILILAENTENEIIGGANPTQPSDLPDEEESAPAQSDSQNAAIFSADDLTIAGNGSLYVEGTGQDGITSKDGLILAGGEITVKALDDGIRGKDYLVVKDSTITVIAEGDGLKSDNTQDEEKGFIYIENGEINITSNGDSIHAQTDLLLSAGSYTLIAGGSSQTYPDPSLSSKGLKADRYVIIDGGNFKINSADDAIHANGSMVINDGSFTIATADDAFHADSSLNINGGEIRITESYEGLESAVITINAGEIFINSQDDGINIVGGVDGSGMERMPGRGQGGRVPPASENPQDGWGDQEETLQGDQRAQGDWPPQENFLSTSNDHLAIHGGNIYIDADGDGIDANGSIEMTAGVVLIHGPAENMNGALDCVGAFNISGGTLVAIGSAGMAEAPDETSTQNSLLLYLNHSYPAGTVIYIQPKDGDEILSFEAMKSFQSIAFSSSDFLEGQIYEVYLNEVPYLSFTLSGTTTQIGQQMRR